MDKVPGGTLAEADEHPSIPVHVACLRTSAEEVIEVTARDLGEPVEVVHFERFLRPLRYLVRLGSFVSSHDSEGRAIVIQLRYAAAVGVHLAWMLTSLRPSLSSMLPAFPPSRHHVGRGDEG